ncbi:hypothetical protein ACET3X_005029 [Alternaria dauci]|uniref:C2H2-type domain-containing protein n=1 Tax=Alternaria dauci TaxID=48095 RepID=A0ABR3ULK6_9PLEO
MLDAIQSVEYYQDDEFLPKSPLLKARFVKATPSPTPPPQITPVFRYLPNRQSIRTRPTQGDWVLIREMDPNRPDIAQKASEQALNSDSDSDPGPGSGDDEMPDAEILNTATARLLPNHDQSVPSTARPANQQPTLREVLASAPDPKATASHRDSVIEDEVIRPFGFAAADRRTSQPSAVHTAPNGVRSNSSDGLSPGAQPTPIEPRQRHMSLDGALASRVLPPPLNSGLQQHSAPHIVGCFKCDYPGCTAAPFQTQYLLNSHTNVHSSNRPHYCPVKDCPRGEGGKGFKRKNEMIRHGLVHQSPGYVCPFCPDREHKYPRPDNLQRHVRVHHTDKDKDDPQLRDVLAQRPEGGSRGRRRRVSDSGH